MGGKGVTALQMRTGAGFCPLQLSLEPGLSFGHLLPEPALGLGLMTPFGGTEAGWVGSRGLCTALLPARCRLCSRQASKQVWAALRSPQAWTWDPAVPVAAQC